MFRIDYKSGLPIYEQIYRNVVRLAYAGAFEENGQLPSVRMVAEELGINPNTVQKAYALLERDGIIHSLPGKGSFLADRQDTIKKQREEALRKVSKAALEALEYGASQEEITKAAQVQGNQERSDTL